MDASFAQNQTMSARMPNQLSSMLARLSSLRANCAKIGYGTRKPLSVPECHNTLGYGTGTAAWIQTQDKL
jgi:hypothetical protein